MAATTARRRLKLFASCLALAAIIAVGAPSWAQTKDDASQPHLLGTFGQWSVYKMTDQGADVCYMLTEAGPAKDPGETSSKSKGKRGKTYLMVTERPIERSFDVVSYAAGLRLLKNSSVDLTIDSKKLSLFTDGSFAWARDPATDRTISAALRAGATLRIEAETSKGKKLRDAYSLKGTSAAYKAMASACGIASDTGGKAAPR